MNITFRILKNIFPELNEKVITSERIRQVFEERNIELLEVPMKGKGCYVSHENKDYVFLRYNLSSLIYHETLLYESVHALLHVPSAHFLKRQHDLEAEVFSLVMMMPLADLPRLNIIKYQLDAENYEYVEQRNKIHSIWNF